MVSRVHLALFGGPMGAWLGIARHPPGVIKAVKEQGK